MSQKIEELKRQLAIAEEEEKEKRANQKFLCGCGKMHTIKNCEAIQTHFYVAPYGCTGGDYWLAGELQIICPDAKIRNRLLFLSQYSIPWEKRDSYKYSAESQFLRNYKDLFKKVTDSYERNTSYQFWNNYYFDKNHKKFGIKIGD